MANEITINLQFNVANGSYKNNNTFYDQITQNTLGASCGTLNVPASTGTLGTVITFGNITTPGWALLQNLDPAGGNYVIYGSQNGSSTGSVANMNKFGRLNAGEVANLRLDPSLSSLVFQAHTATVEINYVLLND